MSIEATHITKAFGTFEALKGINLTVPSGKLVALLGPSGSGKTTLLRIIAGLEEADTGQILLEGEDAGTTAASKRGVGFVFQHYALFRHMTVFENVSFGLRMKPRKYRPSKKEIRERVMTLLKLVQIDWLADRLPSQLSGGQRQRAALARALAVEPKVLLLDEPFGALDAKVRKELRRWLRRLHDEIHVTSVFVTHDVDEALEVSDEVVVMNEGRIEQVGTPDEVYSNPVNAFVYHFLGSVNLFHTRLDMPGSASLDASHETGTGLLYARPHDIDIQRWQPDVSWTPAVITHIHAIGPIFRLDLKRDDGAGEVEAEIPREQQSQQRFCAGDRVYIQPRDAKAYHEQEHPRTLLNHGHGI